MERLAVVALVALVACDKGPSTHLYTDREVAEIERKAEAHASRAVAFSDRVSTWSLRPVMEALEQIRREPGTSLAVRRAVDELAEVRRLAEGDDSISAIYVAQSGERAVADVLEEIIRRGGLSAMELTGLAAQIDHVIATERTLGAALAENLRSLRGWILTGKGLRSSSGRHDARDERALTLAVFDEMDALVASACPPSASLSTCHRQMPGATNQLRLPGQFLDDVADTVGTMDESSRQLLQRDLTHRVAINQLGAYSQYAERSARDISRLVALRVEIQVIRDQSCEVPSRILAPGVLGDRVVVAVVDQAMHVEPPAWAAGSEPANSWTIPCSFQQAEAASQTATAGY